MKSINLLFKCLVGTCLILGFVGTVSANASCTTTVQLYSPSYISQSNAGVTYPKITFTPNGYYLQVISGRLALPGGGPGPYYNSPTSSDTTSKIAIGATGAYAGKAAADVPAGAPGNLNYSSSLPFGSVNVTSGTTTKSAVCPAGGTYTVTGVNKGACNQKIRLFVNIGGGVTNTPSNLSALSCSVQFY